MDSIRPHGYKGKRIHGKEARQVARIEKRGYDAYTLTTLCRYVQTLGQEYSLAVQARHTAPPKRAPGSRAAAAR
jgi:hypothetical protein